MPAQGSVHNGQRAPHQTLGPRTRRRGRADEAQSEPASHACAPRNRRASVRHAEDADGCDALSDEAIAQCRDRNGAERTQLQPQACAEHRRRQAIAGSHAGVRRGEWTQWRHRRPPHVARRCKEVDSRRRTSKILRNRRVGVSHCWSRAVSECGAAFLHGLRGKRTSPGQPISVANDPIWDIAPDQASEAVLCHFSLAAGSRNGTLHALHEALFRRHQMHPREFITLLGSAAASSVSWPLTASAQISSVYRLGTFGPRDAFDDKSPFGSILIRVLAQRGYTLGQNLTLDARGAMGDMHRVPQLLQEMKANKVEALVVTGFPVALAARTVGIPTVVAFGAGDPVATGLVQSLSRPGGNITGISDNATELSTKRLSLLKQLNPSLRRVAMLWNKDDLGMSRRYEASANVAQSVGVTVMPLGVRGPDDFA